MKSSKNKLFDACNIYILLWVCLHVQNMILSSSLVSMLFYIPYLLMTLYYIGKFFVSFRPKGVMLAFSVFFVVQLCYGALLLIFNNVSGVESDSYLKVMFSSLAPIFAFYVFTKQGILTEKKIAIWFIIFIAVAIGEYYTTLQRGILELDREEMTNNASYSFVGLIPFVFIFREKRIWQFLILAVLYYFIVSAMKRGGILIGAILLLWFAYISLKSTPRRKKIGIMLFMSIFLFIGYSYVLDFYENSNYFQRRIEQTVEGGSSGRDYIYSTLWNDYCTNYNAIQLLFGKGAFYTQNIVGLKAHNDWLELLIDCGFIGVLLYLVYWISFAIEWKNSKSNYLTYSMFGACFLSTLAKTFFSMSYTDMPFYTCVIMGYCFAYPYTHQNQQLSQNNKR
ncbi:MAG: hypothetical protein IKY79_00475 [Bacteroidales bacterium]|nr:hypothetical protein [Bacteroidales bacterium]